MEFTCPLLEAALCCDLTVRVSEYTTLAQLRPRLLVGGKAALNPAVFAVALPVSQTAGHVPKVFTRGG